MAGRRICAGYYRRYDGKVVYVISTATDNDTREETVIWTTYPFADVPKYCTSTKKSFCAFVEADGERKAKYKRLMNMKISEAAIERLEDEGFRGPVRKQHQRQLEEEYDSREYQRSLSYLAYAKDLCEHYNFDRSKYRLCMKEKRFTAITRSDFAKLKEDLQFLDNALKTVLLEYRDYFRERFVEGLSISRKICPTAKCGTRQWRPWGGSSGRWRQVCAIARSLRSRWRPCLKCWRTTRAKRSTAT